MQAATLFYSDMQDCKKVDKSTGMERGPNKPLRFRDISAYLLYFSSNSELPEDIRKYPIVT